MTNWLVDNAVSNWTNRRGPWTDSAHVRDESGRWETVSAYVLDEKGHRVCKKGEHEGDWFVGEAVVCRVDRDTKAKTASYYPSQNPFKAFATSLSYLALNLYPLFWVRNIPVTWRTISSATHGSLAVVKLARGAERIWKGRATFRKALSPAWAHARQGMKDCAMVIVTDYVTSGTTLVYDYNPSRLGFVALMLLYAAYDPYQTRVMINDYMARWDVKPVSPDVLASASLADRMLRLFDGSYPLHRVFGMQGIPPQRLEIIADQVENRDSVE